jgi:hypothetical protein
MADDPNISDADLQAALKAYDAHQTAKPQEPARTLGDTYKDLGVGIAKGAAHTALDLGELAGKLPVDLQGGTLRGAVDTLYGKPGLSAAAFPAASEDTAYSNDVQRLGGAVEAAGEMAIPVGKGITAIPSKARSGQVFQDVLKVAKDIPVDTSAPGNVALKIADLAQQGGGTNWGPAPVRQFIQWATDPKKQPMTYEVAKRFASNISALSVKELTSVPPTIMREIGELRVVLNKAVADAAGKAGMGEEYAKAMTEYGRAKQLLGMIDAFVEGSKRAIPHLAYGGAAGAAGAMLWKKIASMMGD